MLRRITLIIKNGSSNVLDKMYTQTTNMAFLPAESFIIVERITVAKK